MDIGEICKAVAEKGKCPFEKNLLIGNCVKCLNINMDEILSESGYIKIVKSTPIILDKEIEEFEKDIAAIKFGTDLPDDEWKEQGKMLKEAEDRLLAAMKQYYTGDVAVERVAKILHQKYRGLLQPYTVDWLQFSKISAWIADAKAILQGGE